LNSLSQDKLLVAFGLRGQLHTGGKNSMMSSTTRLLIRLQQDRSGVTALEYGLIASLAAITNVATVATFGTEFTRKAGKV
jgi:Flp pilus assembly pilin Flp